MRGSSHLHQARMEVWEREGLLLCDMADGVVTPCFSVQLAPGTLRQCPSCCQCLVFGLERGARGKMMRLP